MDKTNVSSSRNGHIAITIDGPAGAGKTTQAKRLANILGIAYVNTGAIYRAFAVYFERFARAAGCTSFAEDALKTFEVRLVWDTRDCEQRTLLCLGPNTMEEMTEEKLRAPGISKLASCLSANPAVRDAMLNIQREVAAERDVVMEGRDIGTVVIPDADVKFYLDADLLVRAHRRKRQLRTTSGVINDYDLVKEMAERDKADMEREVAPLKCTSEHIPIDCTYDSISGTTNTMLEIIYQKLIRNRLH